MVSRNGKWDWPNLIGMIKYEMSIVGFLTFDIEDEQLQAWNFNKGNDRGL